MGFPTIPTSYNEYKLISLGSLVLIDMKLRLSENIEDAVLPITAFWT